MAKKADDKDRARLEELIEEATVDCYNENEQHVGLMTMVEDNIVCPFMAKVIGEEVAVVEIRSSEFGLGLDAVCRYKGKDYRINVHSLEWSKKKPEGFKKKYVGTWLDSTSTILSVLEGTYYATTKTLTFTNDGFAPSSKATLSPSTITGFYSNPTTVTLSATDNVGGSGVASIEYLLDSGSWTTYSGPFPVSGNGSHTVQFHATDVAGNGQQCTARPACGDGAARAAHRRSSARVRPSRPRQSPWLAR